MFKVGDKVFITRGSLQNETGTIVGNLLPDWAPLTATVELDGWSGTYPVSLSSVRIIKDDEENDE